MSLKSLDAQFYTVLLCQGSRADGSPYWAYLQLPPSKAKAFKKAQKKGAFHLEDFGEIIEWGIGAEVPDDVKQRMEREQGVNHRFEEDAKAILRDAAETASSYQLRTRPVSKCTKSEER